MMENTGKEVEKPVKPLDSTLENNSQSDGRTPIPQEQTVNAEVSTKKAKAPKRKRTAVCLTCTNEWIANNGNEEKPSRCPVCGSRKLKWKDETTEYSGDYTSQENNSKDDGRIEIPPENPVEDSFSNGNQESAETSEKPARKSKAKKHEKALENHVENIGKPTLEKNMTLEDAEKMMPKIPMQAIVFIVGGIALFAGICFLVGKGKRQCLPSPRQTEEKKPESYILPSIGGNLA